VIKGEKQTILTLIETGQLELAQEEITTQHANFAQRVNDLLDFKESIEEQNSIESVIPEAPALPELDKVVQRPPVNSDLLKSIVKGTTLKKVEIPNRESNENELFNVLKGALKKNRKQANHDDDQEENDDWD